MKKRTERNQRSLAALLAMLLCLSMLPAAVLAEEEVVPSPTPEADAVLPEDGAEAETTAEPEPSAEPVETQEPDPTAEPTAEPTAVPTAEPTAAPTAAPTAVPTAEPTPAPTAAPVVVPAVTPAAAEEPLEGPIQDPLYYKMMSMDSDISLASLMSNSFARFTPRALKPNETLRKGIDVSVYQKSIDWNAVAKTGIEFAIIRVGYRGSTDGKLYADSYFATNLAGAHKAGLKVGAYIFSQATTTKEAKEEAQYLVQKVKGYQIDLPLVFDFEETGNSDRRMKLSKLSRQLVTDMCNAFCSEVEQSGYQSMVYSNPNTINNHMYRDQIGRLWLAHYTTKTDHASPYEFWQCGYGNVEGVSGTVDLDFWFDPSGKTVTGNGDVTPSASPAPTATPAPTPTPSPAPSADPNATPTPTAEATATPAPTATPPAEENQTSFEDVPSDAWFYDSVQWAYTNGVVHGMTDTEFEPNKTATRGQLVAMLYRMKGEPKGSPSAGFTDLTDSYYVDAVNWAAAKKIVSGYSKTSFGPNNKVTREQLAAMLFRMAGSPAVSGNLNQFTDQLSVQEYARIPMIWAVQKHIVNGYSDKTLLPGASATRAEVCAMLSRFASLG